VNCNELSEKDTYLQDKRQLENIRQDGDRNEDEGIAL